MWHCKQPVSAFGLRLYAVLLVESALLLVPGHLSVRLPQEHCILPALAVLAAPLGLTIPAVTFDQ